MLKLKRLKETLRNFFACFCSGMNQYEKVIKKFHVHIRCTGLHATLAQTGSFKRFQSGFRAHHSKHLIKLLMIFIELHIVGWFLHWFYWTSVLPLTQLITGTNGSEPGWFTRVSYGVPHGSRHDSFKTIWWDEISQIIWTIDLKCCISGQGNPQNPE